MNLIKVITLYFSKINIIIINILGSIYNCDLEDDRNWDWKNPDYEYSPFRNIIRPTVMGK